MFPGLVRFPLPPRAIPVVHEHCDVIIIGTGAGGLLARIEADGDRTMGRFRDAFGWVSAPHLGRVLNDGPE